MRVTLGVPSLKILEMSIYNRRLSIFCGRRIGDTTVMASDGRCLGQPSFQGFSLSLAASDEAEAEQLFAVLGDGGQVQMPLAKTFFSPRFGMVADRFGVSWMVVMAP